jgi:carbon monoxide dehydrogenase subunit G
MKVTGQATLHAPVERVWDALLDPTVLVRTIPGCERLETTGENAYAMTVTAGVAAIKGTYAGTCELRDLSEHRSLVMAAQGAGAPGTLAADVKVDFTDNGDGTTVISYDADTVVGGMVGGVGQRMLTSVSRRMANEFFSAVDEALGGGASGDGGVAAGGAGGGAAASGSSADGGAVATAGTSAGVFTAPPRATGGSSQQDFLKGVAVGAGLVALGVVLGALTGRRR